MRSIKRNLAVQADTVHYINSSLLGTHDRAAVSILRVVQSYSALGCCLSVQRLVLLLGHAHDCLHATITQVLNASSL
jgi:hypothetical protein